MVNANVAALNPTDPAAQLKSVCNRAYNDYGNSCSHAVWYVLTKMVDANTPWRDANHLIDCLAGATGWNEVSVDQGWQLAQAGKVVVGGLKNNPNGHVIVIYPGLKKPSGGYLYTHTDKQTGKVTTPILRSHGIFPRALSTSIGSWPGAKSQGDKTVWDPWASDDAFADVTFWSQV